MGIGGLEFGSGVTRFPGLVLCYPHTSWVCLNGLNQLAAESRKVY